VADDNRFIPCTGDYLFSQHALSLVFRTESVTITAVEFIRKFLLHSLPKRFVRIRHYGFLANRNHRANLKLIRKLLKVSVETAKSQSSLKQMMLKLTGTDITICPC